jgi:hypothetical protein
MTFPQPLHKLVLTCSTFCSTVCLPPKVADKDWSTWRTHGALLPGVKNEGVAMIKVGFLLLLSMLAACSAPGTGRWTSTLCPPTEGGEGPQVPDVVDSSEPQMFQATSPVQRMPELRTGPLSLDRRRILRT